MQCFSNFSGLQSSFKNNQQTSLKTWIYNSEKGSPVWITVRVRPVNLPFSPRSQKLIGASPMQLSLGPSGAHGPRLTCLSPRPARPGANMRLLRQSLLFYSGLFSDQWSQPISTARDLADVDYFEKNYRLTSLPNGKDHWPKLDFSRDLSKPSGSELSGLRSHVYLARPRPVQNKERKKITNCCLLSFLHPHCHSIREALREHSRRVF